MTLRQAFTHPAKLHASSQGNVQVLPTGNVLVGWGAQPYVSEFSRSGELLFDAQLATDYVSYRAFRIPWSGIGADEPTVAVERSRRRTDAFVSWNGDTRVKRWVAMTGTTPATLSPVGSVPRTGFETGMALSPLLTRLAIRGVDGAGVTIGTSALMDI